MELTGLYDEIKEDYIFEHTGEAINNALTQINYNKCLGCKHFDFHECAELSGVASDDKGAALAPVK